MIGPAPPLSLSCVSLPCRRDRPVPGDPVKRLAAPLAIRAAGERGIPRAGWCTTGRSGGRSRAKPAPPGLRGSGSTPRGRARQLRADDLRGERGGAMEAALPYFTGQNSAHRKTGRISSIIKEPDTHRAQTRPVAIKIGRGRRGWGKEKKKRFKKAYFFEELSGDFEIFIHPDWGGVSIDRERLTTDSYPASHLDSGVRAPENSGSLFSP